VICTGNKVIANDLAAQYREVWHLLIGVEMEAGGVAGAAFSCVDPPGFFMIRGVSDLADADKDDPKTAQRRKYPCDVAATYAISLLRHWPVEPSA
jgi:nucleoside phosphorylase